MSFVHLHNHTHYSLLDGLTRPSEAVAIAKEQGCSAVAMTDHGTMYGAIEFYKAAKKEGIKPIIGCEIYVAPEGRLKKEPGTPINHLILLAETNEGYQNLMQLVSKANLEGFYYKPRVDHGLLREFGKGLICLSGCLNSETSVAILDNNEDKAEEIIKMYQDIFGSNNYFLELQNHPDIAEQVLVNNALYRLSEKTGVPLVATCDSHYGKYEDHDVHDILLSLQTGKTLQDADRMKLNGDFSMRNPDDIKKDFADHPEAIGNTVKIADRCNVELNFGKNLIPVFKTPESKGPEEYLRELVEKGLIDRYGEEISVEARERLEYELDIIHSQGFDNYFLIVWDFVNFAKENGVIVGPGRGSAAGSLVAYCLTITDVDPLLYDLLFERFLNPARISMPDIDIDFDVAGRSKVLDYVIEKYGRQNVAQIITFGTMAARAAVRDVGRVMGLPYSDVDRIAKSVPPPVQGRHIPLQTSIEEDTELKKIYNGDPLAKRLLDNAIRLEGTVRHAGTHACAVVMADEPLSEYTPLQRGTGDDDSVITQFSMKPLEELGLLKMDFLGLKNLSVIEGTLQAIQRIHGDKKIELNKLPLDDKKTFDLLAHGDTTGVFQLESGGMRRYLKELKPTEINDIIAMVSLYRPGPMPWIPMYIKGKHDPAKVHYLHESFEKILKETYGVAVYQEQILKLARQFAGFSLGEADILRKAVGKKDPKLLAGEKQKFIDGAVAEGHSKKFADEVFKKVIEPFAAYGFNKSHATCYALISYYTAYLKANHAAEFMAALLTADATTEDRVVIEVNECEEMGIHVLPPDVNESLADFTVIDDKTIRFGLRAIKGIGEQPIAEIIRTRAENGRFESLEDFFRKIPDGLANKKLVEALALSGAFDSLGERNSIAASVQEIVAFAKSVHDIRATGQGDLFASLGDDENFRLESFRLKKVTPASRLEKLRYEKKFLGLFVTGHPLQGLKHYMTKKALPIGKIEKKHFGKTAKFCGLLTTAKKISTKSGAYMMYVTLEDLSGRIEGVLFPRIYQQFGESMQEGTVLSLEGKVEMRGDKIQLIVGATKPVSLESMISNAKESGEFDMNEKYVRVGSEHRVLEDERASGVAEEKPPYVIQLTDKMDPESLAFLKQTLSANKGDRKVVLKIKIGKEEKDITVPFGVDLSTKLVKEIGAIAK